jgi:DNA-binding response OmpR family regulator
METDKARRHLALLLVDDDTELASMMKAYFAKQGHHLDCAYNGREGLARALNGAYDLMILDVMLPIVDGFSILTQLRRWKDLPVIMLTARSQQQDRISGLNSGADDYLPKPFDLDELYARIHAVLRRSSASLVRSEPITVGNMRLDCTTREVWCGGKRIDLTTIEFEILDFFMRSAGRVVSRDEIISMLFDREASPYDRFLDVHISHLRKKLVLGGFAIRAIRGVGYIFAAKEQESSE